MPALLAMFHSSLQHRSMLRMVVSVSNDSTYPISPTGSLFFPSLISYFVPHPRRRSIAHLLLLLRCAASSCSRDAMYSCIW